jgi:hypothetical protein
MCYVEKGAGRGLSPNPWFYCKYNMTICIVACVRVYCLDFNVLHCIYVYHITFKMCAGYFNLWLIHMNPWFGQCLTAQEFLKTD